MVVQIKSGKRENGKSFCCNLYRKRFNGGAVQVSVPYWDWDRLRHQGSDAKLQYLEDKLCNPL